jgi:SAM-dependent methyltransferase
VDESHFLAPRRSAREAHLVREAAVVLLDARKLLARRQVWVPAALSTSEERLKEELAHNLVDPDNADELRGYLDFSFRRLLTTLDFVPDSGGRVLELGANPYFLTLLLERFRRFELELANFFGGSGENAQQIRNEETGESHEFRYREFNVEQDQFPYPDAHFDGVIYCEILEHLIRDPTASLAEIHRVLKPGGWLLLTTPNVARRQNVMCLVRGKNMYDPYSGYGPYGRHNREYTAGELRELLANTGFEVTELTTQDLHACSRRSKLLALVLGPESGYNLYALSRRKAEFRWYYPPWMLRSGMPQRRVRDPFVRVGSNDAVQLGGGWHYLEDWPDGPMRWTRSRAEAFIRARGGETQLRLLVWGGPKERAAQVPLRVDVVAPGRKTPSKLTATVPLAAWTWVELAIPEPLPPGEIKVTIESPAFVPARVLGGPDKRDLGVGFRELGARG